VEFEVHPTRDLDLTELCPFESGLFQDIGRAVDQLQIKPGKKSSAAQLGEWFANLVQKSGWLANFRFNADIPLVRAYSNYLMDAVVDGYESTCGHHHRVSIQSCFDNREAIGTNLLKFEIASKKYSKNDEYRALGILICASRETKKRLKLDNSVGTLEEYEVAIRTAYKNILHCRVIQIEII
jgi:hypothetical protein